MSTADKNKLDELFKSGLYVPNGHAEYQEADWDNLEWQLNKGKKRGVVLWLPYLSTVAAVLLVFMGWWFFKPIKKQTQQPAMVNNRLDTTIKRLPALSGQPNNAIIKNQTSAQKEKTDGDAINASRQTANQKVGETELAQNTQVVPPQIKQIRATDNGKNTGAIKYNVKAGNPLKDELIANVSDPKAVKQTDVSTETTKPANNPPVQQQTLPVGAEKGEAVAQNPIGNTVDAERTQEAIVAKPPAKKVDDMPGTRRGPRLSITVLASPDINGVGSFKQTEWGQNVGLLFSAGLGKKLTISTGVAYSKKPYSVAFSQYVSTYKFRTDPQQVMADCRVLDIPLNVDYKFYNKGRNAFSVGTGLSSYFMLRETYKYQYAAGTYGGPADYTVRNQNRHILGVLNLNTTYQRQINNKFSVGVQPYLKIPLTHIGNSQVKLQSAGIAVGVSWNINSKNP